MMNCYRLSVYNPLPLLQLKSEGKLIILSIIRTPSSWPRVTVLVPFVHGQRHFDINTPICPCKIIHLLSYQTKCPNVYHTLQLSSCKLLPLPKPMAIVVQLDTLPLMKVTLGCGKNHLRLCLFSINHYSYRKFCDLHILV